LTKNQKDKKKIKALGWKNR